MKKGNVYILSLLLLQRVYFKKITKSLRNVIHKNFEFLNHYQNGYISRIDRYMSYICIITCQANTAAAEHIPYLNVLEKEKKKNLFTFQKIPYFIEERPIEAFNDFGAALTKFDFQADIYWHVNLNSVEIRHHPIDGWMLI